jgi:hypothetical protein
VFTDPALRRIQLSRKSLNCQRRKNDYAQHEDGDCALCSRFSNANNAKE